MSAYIRTRIVSLLILGWNVDLVTACSLMVSDATDDDSRWVVQSSIAQRVISIM